MNKDFFELSATSDYEPIEYVLESKQYEPKQYISFIPNQMPNHNQYRMPDNSYFSVPNNIFPIQERDYLNHSVQQNDYYFAQVDMDLAWMDNITANSPLLFGDITSILSSKDTNSHISVVLDFEKAIEVGEKICKYAELIHHPLKQNKFTSEKILTSSSEPGKYSYPLFGMVIFGLKFKNTAVIENIGKINKDQYYLIKERLNKNIDVIEYIPTWQTDNFTNKKRAIIFSSAFPKLEITDIYLKESSCALGRIKGSAMLQILETSSNENRFGPKYTNLLRKLLQVGKISLN